MRDLKKDYFHWGNKVGLFFLILFIICFFWYFLRPVEQELHVALLRLSFFGFTGMNLLSFILGLAQSYLWGYIAVGAWFIVVANCKSCR